MTPTEIDEVTLRRVLDSRGNATVEADVRTTEGFGRASAPSGASTGEYEAVEISAKRAVERGEEAGEALVGTDAANQRAVDETLRDEDGTDDFSRIGANAAVAISMATADSAADALGVRLHRHLGGAFASSTPTPLGNVVGGGEHADDATDIQEFLVAPTGAETFEEAVFTNAAVHAGVKDVLDDRGVTAGKGDEGAWAPSIDDPEALEVVAEAVDRAADVETRIGLDVAASELWDDDAGAYVYGDTTRDTEEQVDYVESLVREGDLIYVEDPLREDDFEAFARLTERLADTDTLVCGDDLFVTNVERIEHGVAQGAANSVLIKPNQVGTVTGAYEAVKTARDAGYETVMSHRSGETEDATIASLSVGFGTGLIKTGTVGGERTAKLNEVIRIQRDMER
ncbi:enolase [Haladaptatus sp. F3-133]|jgi:enolase|uniref:Enolase n=1 Tax=Halorutilus salinus TaxID=2487751 RepID=A0A9Q4C112_9EURY|nr:phosphopyruvate hydratase [Halorutilus salinus]MCX2817977.1 enolase [Halorutilus salinus]